MPIRRRPSAENPGSRLNNDAGVATLEAVIVFPVVLLATFIAFQAVLFYMAHTATTNAAQIALETARAQSSSAEAGQSAGTGYLSGQNVVSDGSVDVSRGGDTVTVEARGTAPSLVPFDLPDVTSTLSAPVEEVSQP